MPARKGPDGRFAPNIDTATRDADAARLRARGLSYPEIARQLGYASHSSALAAARRAMAATVAEPAAEVRAYEVERLNNLERAALEVLERRHVTVSHGKVIYHGEGDAREPLYDDGPVLQAIDRLLRIQERRAKLLGLDAPTRMQVVTIDAVDAEIARLTAELAAQPGPRPAGEAQAIEGTATTQG